MNRSRWLSGGILWLSVGILGLAACQSQSIASERSTPPPGRSATDGPRLEPPPERVFGAPLSGPGEVLDVARVLNDPSPYLRRDIKCRGTVARVCQAAGCWLELQGPEGKEGLRVPMAGHAFFVPQDIVGKSVVVEGRLAARELLETERAHLTGEGLKATGPLFLEATGVVVR